MKLTQRLSAAVLAGSVLFFAASAQAELIDPSLIKPAFQLSQATTTNPANPVNPGSSLDSNPDTSTGLTAPDSPAVSNPNTGNNSTTVNPPTINNNITIPNPAPNTTVTQPNRSTTVTPPQTQVEVRNEAPALSQPAPAPNIDIDMPDAPDINVTVPGNTSTDSGEQTVTERTERYIFNDTDDDDPVTNNNILYMAVFGILAVFLIAVIAMAAARRRHLYVDDTRL